MNLLRVGLAGFGVMGRNHARVLQSLPDVELIGIADEAICDGGPGEQRIVESVDELVKLGLDYAVVALPTVHHMSAALLLAEAKVPTLIEKPLAQDIESARRVVEAFDDVGVLAAVGHIERYNPALRQARNRIEAGELGTIYQVATRRQGPFPARISDVGVVKDLGTHDIDLTAWLTGERYVTVAAQTARRSGRDHEDLVAAVGHLSNGIVTNHLVNWLSPIKERTIVVTGELGAFVVDTLRADLTFYSNGSVATTWAPIAQFRGVSEGDVIRYAFERREPLVAEHEAFRDAVLGTGNDIVTAREGLRTIEVAEALLQSANEDTVVRI
ncbi:MAG: Gfo/Idh/MocA family oxidoreductase [Candidatus Nanopelagicales bacterium]